VDGLLEDPDVWNNPDNAQKLGKEKRMLEGIVNTLSNLEQGINDSQEFFEMAKEENDDESLLSIASDSEALEKTVEEMEFRRMFSEPMDENNCFIEFQSGSGGGFKVEVLEQSEGDVAGIKGASLKVSGDYAFGTLRTENGVHRLVRKSPFDSNAKRHTSFASVQIFPEVDDSIDIEINPADIRLDTYRASGAGGQHINKTDSAVRLTHIPTGVVVQCQNDRSQHRNKDEAMNMLKGALYNLELSKRNEEKQALEDAKTDIGWGHQIRSYVLDQGRIKDLRTNVEVGNTQGVLDGDLDQFIEVSLKQGV